MVSHNVSHTCPVCSSDKITASIAIPEVPVYCNVLWPTHGDAISATKGGMQMGFCQACGHLFNMIFDPALMDYNQEYENSLHFSPRFQEYAESLASRLIEKYNLYDKDIVEIGCGKGDFLKLLCRNGKNRGFGFDKTFEHERDAADNTDDIRFIQDYYSEKYTDLKKDLICCQHVLEHIEAPSEFLSDIRRSIKSDGKTLIYFEVPNALYTIKDLGIWDLIYEHCGYFSEQSLSVAFNNSGFEILEISDSFAGQYLYIEAKAGGQACQQAFTTSTGSGNDLVSLIENFTQKYNEKVQYWRKKLEELDRRGKRAVIWGAGSKGVTFLNVLGTQNTIEYVIDLNPHKHGKYVPGTGQQVKPPQFLVEYAPDYVILMNNIYAQEVKHDLDAMHVDAEIIFA